MSSLFFTKSKGVFFYILLAFLLYGYEAMGRAPRFCPDVIKLSGSTFIAEKITIAEPPGTMAKILYKKGEHNITFGNTVISHNGKCWFNLNSKKCLSQEIADKSKSKCIARYDSIGCNICSTDEQGNAAGCTKKHCTGGQERANKCVEYSKGAGHHVAITKNGKEIGLVEVDDKSRKLYAYSISAAGQKDERKPYLEFHEVTLPIKKGADSFRNYKLTVSAYDGGRLIGKYESLSDDRNNGTGKPKNCPNRILDLRGKQFLLKRATD